ncbi:hypothetical protein PHMEG_00034638 [Phytophthora megakarya]|uniref:Eukaryotic/viral aspartic protease n=1 Tax=Phytophthora megakarya TaxID=4795 RepID=A0A225UQJ2_9STRA|nr:hypothetical protein PHMEG_00034638 [Phytophthora megakarya]
MTPITEYSVSFDDSVDYSDAKEDDEDDYLEGKTPVSELSEGAVPVKLSCLPTLRKSQLPQTPVKQNEPSTSVFGSKGSPYMHDSHMMTPRSASRHNRVVKENEVSRPTPNTYNGPAQQSDRPTI